MRGTPRETNKALLAPNHICGAEMRLVIMSVCFWAWVVFGLLPHLVALIALFGFGINMYLLRFFAKKDPMGSEVFRNNSSFIVTKSIYPARAHAGHIRKVKKVVTVPVSKLARF